MKLLDNQSHLKAPVAQMHVSDYLMSHIAADALNALSNDGRAQMSHVKRLRHVGAAVVHDNGLRLLRLLQTILGILRHAVHIPSQVLRRNPEIDKARHNGVNLGEHSALLRLLHHLACNINRLLLICLSSGHGSVALILAQIRTVGNCDLHIFLIVSAGSKSRRQLRYN